MAGLIQLSIMILASAYSFFHSLSPPQVLFTHSLVGSSSTLPLISWQFVVIQTKKKEKVVDPVITFGRQNTIYFYQVSNMVELFEAYHQSCPFRVHRV